MHFSLTTDYNEKLCCRKETMRLLHRSVLAQYNWETIFCWHYRSILGLVPASAEKAKAGMVHSISRCR